MTKNKRGAETDVSAAADPSALYRLDHSDPRSELVDRSGHDDADLRQIARLMEALRTLRAAEERLSEASLKYMRLSSVDMRALHFLIVAGNTDVLPTPGAIAAHLGISSASTTKLLDRLERGGHISRERHPDDRRALVIRITPETRDAAMRTVGQQQANRFNAAARLAPQEREIVERFLRDMTAEIDVSGLAWAQAGEASAHDDAEGAASR
ncbi:MarR family winged helix-turn-helix transcriptional regulator [Leucobacter chromiiresistens]|uniref:DNA-binding transcriptional regulator, MarR family n=1 Tax=Leucobacter chromiiresistens TaxID=1079994 RepID=A0A1H0YL55_9MICO|nr:MarR family transcriptional regulator [Leucobacter chromiiresistens]SDQ15913.1 DNA-binding transcriptional regulator, MarR family [Leucobacter chromiiresistens]